MTDLQDLACESESGAAHKRVGITRRGFLKTTAAVGAAAIAGTGALTALADEDPAASGAQEEVFASACRSNCQQGCQLNLHVRDGKITRVSAFEYPEESYNRICSKGYTNMYRTYSAERTKYPLRRVEGTARGAGEWERISWDEAISEISEKIKAAQAEYGSSAFTMFWWGSGNYASANGTSNPCFQDRFVSATGSTRIQISVDQGGQQAGKRMGSYQAMPEAKYLLNGKSFIFWGGNFVVSFPQAMHFIFEAQKSNGAKLICIDPNYSPTAAKCDWYIPIQPGSDGLLAMGMEKIIIENKWYDEEFLKKHTTAGALMFPDGVKMVRASDLGQAIEGDPLMCMSERGSFEPAATCTDPVLFSEGEIVLDGRRLRTSLDFVVEQLDQYTLDDISEKTTIPLETIQELADHYAHTHSFVHLGFGVNHYTNASWTYFALYMLPALCGQYNSEDSGMSMGLGSGGSWNYQYMTAPEPPDDAGPEIPLPCMTEAVDNESWNNKPYHPEVLYIACADYLNNHSNRPEIMRIMDKFKTIIVADPFMTDTARYADYVLPASFWFEVEDVYNCQYGSAPFLHHCDKVIDPLWESKSDYEIYNLILKGLGKEDVCINDLDEWFNVALDTPENKKLGLTFETLRANKTMRAKADVPYVPTGRFQFAIDEVTPLWTNNQELNDEEELTQPRWKPPVEAWPESELAEKYPLQAISRRSRYRTHTQWWDVPVLNELDSEPSVMINPVDAEKYGIEDFDYMRVYNDRGSFVARARYHSGIRPGTIYQSRGYQGSQYVEGHHDSIHPTYCEPYVHNQTFYDTRVAVEKA